MKRTALFMVFLGFMLITMSCGKPTDPGVVSPIFNPPQGAYVQEQLVSISCATSGAEIRYTLDGSEPPTNSLIYTQPILVTNGSTVIKAKAYKAGSKESVTTTSSYYIGVLPAPSFSPIGGTYTSNQTVIITCDTPGVDIRYTNDGSEPGLSSSQYTVPIEISSNTTLKSKAFITDFVESSISTANYSFRAATPTIHPGGGTYSSNQTVTIYCSTFNAIIRYSTNGTEPNSGSTQYTAPFAVSGNTTIKAKAFKAGWIESYTATGNFEFTVATPSFNPPGGTYATNQSVLILCNTPGSTIRYTTDGTNPTSSSTQYISPIEISNITTLKAKAFKANWNESVSASTNYIIYGDIVVQGGSFHNGSSNVTLSSYYISNCEVSQTEYLDVMGYNPSHLHDNLYRPVETVSWFDAIKYCNRRSLQEGLTPCYGYLTYGTNPSNWPVGWDTIDTNHTNISCNWNATGYRLPTEMEWQFAARGGNQTHGYTYSGSNNINEVAWYNSNSGNIPHIIGTKIANELGTFDMSGNVWEWVWDIYGNYPSGSQTNPHGASSGTQRVYRGGSYGFYDYGCPVAYRDSIGVTLRSSDLGFRCVRISP